MTSYIVILAVGPVQSMIAAARKSRDLWSGSALLSELAKACALSLAQQGAELIFPAITTQHELKPNSDLSVGNKIQVLIQAADQRQVKSIVDAAKAATRQRFIDEAALAKGEISHQQDLRDNIWQQQVNDYVEVQAAWAKVDETRPEGYQQAVELASKILAARKATRDFNQCSSNPYSEALMLPKSSLDGVRETVLHESQGNNLKNLTRLQLGLSPSEQLDCLGIVKRLGLKRQADQFTPFTRVAAQPWLEQVLKQGSFRQQLTALNQQYQRLVDLRLATKVKGNQGIYQDLPFDGQLLYRSRLDVEISNYRYDPEASSALATFKQAIEPLWRQFGQPCSYGVLLLADGDRMGELLDQAKTLQDHKTITLALSSFAGGVAALMRQYQGHCIYAGGDDVLGFVPLHQAYACAKALSEAFHAALAEVATRLQASLPTLSVGMAISHVMTPLGVIRELAQKAEKYAKGDHLQEVALRRNALGVCLDVRSGNVTLLRLPWNDSAAQQQFNNWIACYTQHQLPSRIAYETREIDLRTKHISKDPQIQQGIRHAEFKRMLKKARLMNGQKITEPVQVQLNQRELRIGLQSLADELIIARWFAAKTQKDLGQV